MPGDFLGEYELLLGQRRCIKLPHLLSEAFRNSKNIELIGCPVIMAPVDECLSLFPLSYFKNSNVLEWLGPISWTDNVEEVVSGNKFYPCNPFYETNKISEKLREASEILITERKANPAVLEGLSGQDFERLLYEILTSLHVNVQMNVHLLGAEIDLLLLELNENGRMGFTIIECKHRQASRRVVEISQIMRLYGLQEALRRDFRVNKALLVSTTGFSQNAKRFAKIYNLDLRNYQGFLDWIDAHNLMSESKSYPLFRLMNLDKYGRFFLPECLQRYIKVHDNHIVVIGVGHGVEIWSPSLWNLEKESILNIVRDFGPQTI